jgi:hypothetical protein
MAMGEPAGMYSKKETQNKTFFEYRFKDLRDSMRDIRDVLSEFKMFTTYSADQYKDALDRIDKILKKEML